MNSELRNMKSLLTFFLTLTCFGNFVLSQFVMRPDTVSVKDDRPVYSESIASDPHASSYVIVIEKGVPAHLHKEHTEYVYVISGEAELFLDDTLYVIRPGDLIYIPPVTIHEVEVLSDEPLRVISIQSPEFKGKDRYFIPLRDREEKSTEGARY